MDSSLICSHMLLFVNRCWTDSAKKLVRTASMWKPPIGGVNIWNKFQHFFFTVKAVTTARFIKTIMRIMNCFHHYAWLITYEYNVFWITTTNVDLERSHLLLINVNRCVGHRSNYIIPVQLLSHPSAVIWDFFCYSTSSEHFQASCLKKFTLRAFSYLYFEENHLDEKLKMLIYIFSS